MAHVELLALVERLADLPRADLAQVTALLGTALLPEETAGQWLEYSTQAGTPAFASAKARLHATNGFGLIRLTPNAPLPHRDAIGIGAIGTFQYRDLNPNISTEGATTYVCVRRGGALELYYSFNSRSDTLREVGVTWTQPRIAPGAEAVFQSAPPLLYLPSYDTVNELLEYACVPRTARFLTRTEFGALGAKETLGAFARGVPAKSGAGALFGAVFATPAGPALIAGNQRALAQHPKTEAHIAPLPDKRRRFSLSRCGSQLLELIYEERHGLGTNPYDQEEADVDLFVAIRQGLQNPRWYEGYTRAWI